MSRQISCVLLVVVATILLSPTAHAAKKPKVSWGQPAIHQEFVAGESVKISTTVSFSNDINTASLWIVPELHPYVSVTPAVIVDAPGGEAIPIEITVSAPSTTEPNGFDGTIHIRDGKRTLAKPLPVSIEIRWIEQRNSDGEFSVSYPAPFHSTNIESKTQISDAPILDDGDGPAPIELFAIPQGISVVLNLIRPRFIPGEYIEDTIYVNNVPSTRIQGQLNPNAFGWGGHQHTFVVIPRGDGTVLQYRYNSEDPWLTSIAEQVLSQIQLF